MIGVEDPGNGVCRSDIWLASRESRCYNTLWRFDFPSSPGDFPSLHEWKVVLSAVRYGHLSLSTEFFLVGAGAY